jgi:hypothetical protein
MVVPASLKYLMRSIYLLDEDKGGKTMGHDKVRDFDDFWFDLCKKFKIHSITSPDDEDDILASIASIFDEFRESASRECFASFIEKIDGSFELLQRLKDGKSLLHYDILDIGMRNRLEGDMPQILVSSFFVFVDRNRKMLMSVRDRKDCDHS